MCSAATTTGFSFLVLEKLCINTVQSSIKQNIPVDGSKTANINRSTSCFVSQSLSLVVLHEMCVFII